MNDTFRVLRYSYDNADGVPIYHRSGTNPFNFYSTRSPKLTAPHRPPRSCPRATQRATSIGELGKLLRRELRGRFFRSDKSPSDSNWSPYQRSAINGSRMI